MEDVQLYHDGNAGYKPDEEHMERISIWSVYQLGSTLTYMLSSRDLSKRAWQVG